MIGIYLSLSKCSYEKNADVCTPFFPNSSETAVIAKCEKVNRTFFCLNLKNYKHNAELQRADPGTKVEG